MTLAISADGGEFQEPEGVEDLDWDPPVDAETFDVEDLIKHDGIPSA